jgi:DNA-damage-inducible protein D
MPTSDTTPNSLSIFENFKIRRQYDQKTETWYFSVIDIVAALTEQTDYNKANNYYQEGLINLGSKRNP